jgi:hypothetical protein
MINFIKRLFYNKPTAPTVNKKAVFTVEYYPLSKKYFPLINNHYLQECDLTGNVTFTVFNNIIYAWSTKCNTEREAWNIVNRYKEQHYKTNVVVIQEDNS